MTGRLLKNALCAGLRPPRIEPGDIRIRDGAVTDTGRVLSPLPGEPVDDLQGALVLPGFVCAHTHLYSALARGMPAPEAEPDGFMGILRDVWWKLDRALDPEAVYYSAAVGALEAVQCGVTTLVDHHASPNAIGGSLSVIEQALRETGIRGILCYETSDRDGPERRDAGLEENERFIVAHRDDTMMRGLVGGHASFTLSDDSLRRLGDLAERHATGVHLHLAEDRADAAETIRLFRRDILDRFDEHGLLRKESVFAHAIHLDETGYERLQRCGCWLVHNPRSNMANRVGHAPLNRFGARSALGTDGFPADMFEEARAAWFKDRESPTRAGLENIFRLVTGGHDLVSGVFGRPIGDLEAGFAADLVVMEYIPPTPFSPDTLRPHALFGLRSSMVESVMVGGEWVVRHRRHLRIDRQDLHRRAARVAAQLWKRIHG